MSLLDSIIQTDLVHYTTDTSPTTIQRREVYIAIRNDSLPGSGTADDPYNGSTDALLDPVLATGISE